MIRINKDERQDDQEDLASQTTSLIIKNNRENTNTIGALDVQRWNIN